MLKEAKGLKYTPLTKEERALRLQRLYDNALYWLENAVETQEPKGTGAATMVLERTRLEVIELQRTGQGPAQQKIELTFKCGCDKCAEKAADDAE